MRKLEEELVKISRLRKINIQEPQGADERRLRRVAIWAGATIFGFEKKEVQDFFRIQSRQSIHRILSRKELDEEEYNLRRELKKALEQKLARLDQGFKIAG